MDVLVLDSTKEHLYENLFLEFLPASKVKVVTSIERARAFVQRRHFHLIFISKIPGRGDMRTFCDSLRRSRSSRTSQILISEDNPTVLYKCLVSLRGRNIRHFNTWEMDRLRSSIEEITVRFYNKFL